MRYNKLQRTTTMGNKGTHPYLLPAADFKPAYLALFRSGELQQRRDEALASQSTTKRVDESKSARTSQVGCSVC